MKALGLTTKSTVLAHIFGQTEGSTMAVGRTTTCKDSAFISTQTVCGTMASTSTTKRKASVFTTGLMAANMMAGGIKANSTESVPTQTSKSNLLSMVYGSSVKG